MVMTVPPSLPSPAERKTWMECRTHTHKTHRQATFAGLRLAPGQPAKERPRIPLKLHSNQEQKKESWERVKVSVRKKNGGREWVEEGERERERQRERERGMGW